MTAPDYFMLVSVFALTFTGAAGITMSRHMRSRRKRRIHIKHDS